MPARLGILVLLVAAVLSGCGGGDGKPKADPTQPSTRLTTASDPLTESPSVPCSKYAATARKIAESQTKLYDPKAGSEADAALDQLVSELAALKDGAPADVQAALDDLSDAFEKVRGIQESPSSEAQAKLAQLAQKLSADSQKVTTYFVAECQG